jgi:hypothetical protein
MKKPLTPDEEERQALTFALIIALLMGIIIISIIANL